MTILIILNIVTLIGLIVLLIYMRHLDSRIEDTCNQSWDSSHKSELSLELIRTYLNPFSECSYFNTDVEEIDNLLEPRLIKYVSNEERLSKINVDKPDGRLINEQSKLAREIGQLLLRRTIISGYKDLKEVIS